MILLRIPLETTLAGARRDSSAAPLDLDAEDDGYKAMLRCRRAAPRLNSFGE